LTHTIWVIRGQRLIGAKGADCWGGYSKGRLIQTNNNK